VLVDPGAPYRVKAGIFEALWSFARSFRLLVVSCDMYSDSDLHLILDKCSILQSCFIYSSRYLDSVLPRQQSRARRYEARPSAARMDCAGRKKLWSNPSVSKA
jgi:hypothetical protein